MIYFVEAWSMWWLLGLTPRTRLRTIVQLTASPLINSEQVMFESNLATNIFWQRSYVFTENSVIFWVVHNCKACQIVDVVPMQFTEEYEIMRQNGLIILIYDSSRMYLSGYFFRLLSPRGHRCLFCLLWDHWANTRQNHSWSPTRQGVVYTTDGWDRS